jgi:PPP family 3-phenylpropionic acid transporter
MKFIGAGRDFPLNLCALQTIYYCVQAVYGSYLALYCGSIGFSRTQIGFITSASTLAVLLTQPFWGYASDRASDGRTILSVLFLAAGALVLGFYVSSNFIYVLALAAALAIFHNPIPPLIDSLTLETLERQNSRFDYGQIRIGGTLGYAFMVLAVARFMNGAYHHIFYLSSALLFAGFVAVRFAAASKFRKRGAALSFRALLRDRKIFCFIFINLIHALSMMAFYNYYVLYFEELGASGTLVGVLLFATALSELPFWFLTGKLVKRFGHDKMMLISIAIVGLRWILLFFIKNPVLAIAASLVHGFCFVTISYSVITYMNDNIPKELRATGQTMNNLCSMIGSRVVGGIAFGVLSDRFGLERMFLLIAALSFIGGLVFWLWYRAIRRGEADGAAIIR